MQFSHIKSGKTHKSGINVKTVWTKNVQTAYALDCRSSHQVLSLNDILLDSVEEICAVIAVDIQGQLLGEVEAEDTHDGLSVDGVSAGYDINVILAAGNDSYEILDVVDGVNVDFYCSHNNASFPE